MSSGIEPHSIAVMNYAEMRNSVLDLMLPYGDAGRECIVTIAPLFILSRGAEHL